MEDEELDIPYMDEFATYLETVGKLSKKTIRRHVLNAEEFIYYMATHGYEVDPDCKDELPMDAELLGRGESFLGMYYSYFLPRKCFATPNTLRQSTASVKKLYKFLAHEGVVSEEVCKDVCEVIKDEAPFWAEECDEW